MNASNARAFQEADILRFSSRSIGSLGDGLEALQEYVESQGEGFDLEDDGGGKTTAKEVEDMSPGKVPKDGTNYGKLIGSDGLGPAELSHCKSLSRILILFNF